MTCIVGITEGGKVSVGGDSAGVAGYVTQVRSDPKVFQNGSFLIGFTTSFRMGQLLRYAFHAPELPDGMDVFDYMVKMFVDNVRECLKTGGYAKKESEQESGGCFLVGYAGRLFVIENDFQVSEAACGYTAIGSGQEVALGALYASQGQPPTERIHTALRAAAEFVSSVRPPFVIKEI